MKTIILCGGTGTRMKEETEFKPKPLVMVGGKPILWHIMKIYAHYGHNEFILALGYKGDMIKDYFLHERTLVNNFTLETKSGALTFHNNECDDFKITFVETGADSLTGERIRRVRDHISGDFMVTYGDGVGDIDINELIDFHHQQKTIGTITAVRPNNRFGILDINHSTKKLKSFFQYKISDDTDDYIKDYINGGFMVFSPKVFDILEKDSMIEHVFLTLSKKDDLSVYEHLNSWKCMDTYKEVEELNELWKNNPFWKVWN